MLRALLVLSLLVPSISLAEARSEIISVGGISREQGVLPSSPHCRMETGNFEGPVR